MAKYYINRVDRSCLPRVRLWNGKNYDDFNKTYQAPLWGIVTQTDGYPYLESETFSWEKEFYQLAFTMNTWLIENQDNPNVIRQIKLWEIMAQEMGYK